MKLFNIISGLVGLVRKVSRYIIKYPGKSLLLVLTAQVVAVTGMKRQAGTNQDNLIENDHDQFTDGRLRLASYSKVLSGMNEAFLVTFSRADEAKLSSPLITSAADDQFLIAWNEKFANINGQQFDDDGSRILMPLQMVTQPANATYATYPYSMKILFNGNLFLTYNKYVADGSEDGVFGQIFDMRNRVKLGNEFQINTLTSGRQRDAKLDQLSNNNIIVVWSNYGIDTSVRGVRGQLVNVLGQKQGSEFRLNTFTANSQYQPDVAALPNNKFIAAWISVDQGASGSDIFAQLFELNGDKSGSEFRVNTLTLGEQLFPSITRISDNMFLIAWYSMLSGANAGISCQLFNVAAQKIGGEFQLKKADSTLSLSPQIIKLNAHFAMTWTYVSKTEPQFGIAGQLYRLEGNLIVPGNPFTIQTYTIPSGVSVTLPPPPVMTSLAKGNGVAAWLFSPDAGSNSSAAIYGYIIDPEKIDASFQREGGASCASDPACVGMWLGIAVGIIGGVGGVIALVKDGFNGWQFCRRHCCGANPSADANQRVEHVDLPNLHRDSVVTTVESAVTAAAPMHSTTVADATGARVFVPSVPAPRRYETPPRRSDLQPTRSNVRQMPRIPRDPTANRTSAPAPIAHAAAAPREHRPRTHTTNPAGQATYAHSYRAPGGSRV